MHQKRDFVKKFAEFADNYIFLKSGDEKNKSEQRGFMKKNVLKSSNAAVRYQRLPLCPETGCGNGMSGGAFVI